jgi:hypothetical protein
METTISWAIWFDKYLSFFLAVLTFFGAIIGAGIMVAYYRRSDRRQEKALLVLFIQEFVLLFKRCGMYYHQMAHQSVSFSSLYEATDSSTLEKLATVCSNQDVLSTILQLKANFFQVIKWANRVNEGSQSPISSQSANDSISSSMLAAQSKAMAFFIGDLRASDNSFGRMRYQEYITDIISRC